MKASENPDTTQYAVRVFDSAPGQKTEIKHVASAAAAAELVSYYQQLNATRGTYGIFAEVLTRTGNDDWTEAVTAR